jgi:hypothetical protein
MYSACGGPEATASDECKPENKNERAERNVNHRCFEPVHNCCLLQNLEETFLKSSLHHTQYPSVRNLSVKNRRA